MENNSNIYDYIVVGAGFAGLAYGLLLVAQNLIYLDNLL